MNDVLYLAWRYLRYHRLKTVVLVSSIAVILFLPVGLNILLQRGSQQLRSRAETTPLLVGAKGSPLQMVLRSLYFENDEPQPIDYDQVRRIQETQLAKSIPIYSRFRSPAGPIVGTSLDYFEYRQLRLREGRQITMLGECVIGSKVAHRHQLKPGDAILSSPEGVFDLAGVYPLKLRVVGVFESTGSPDDQAVFVDLKTSWVIQGFGHGHQDVAADANRDDNARRSVTGSPRRFNEITPDNLSTFHFHGDSATYPITSIIAVPNDEKSSTLLQGRYLSDGEVVQVVRPATVMNELLGTILTAGRYVTVAVLIAGLATLLTMALVFVLSIQLRRRELETMVKIGAAKHRVWAVLGAEVAGVLCLGCLTALVLSVATSWLAQSAARWIIQWS